MTKKKPAQTQEKAQAQAEGLCDCGSNMVAQGASMCGVCKALYDRDRRKAKAKAKAKMKKAKKAILKDEVVQVVIQELFTHVMGVLEDKYGGEKTKKAVIIATIAHELNQTLPTNDIEVRSSFIVSGKDTDRGCTYDVIEA